MPDAPPPTPDQLHRLACESGRPSYIDPATGYEVLTATFLASRGACCGNGCRHCPYPSNTGYDPSAKP